MKSSSLFLCWPILQFIQNNQHYYLSKQQDMKNRMTVVLSILDNVMKLTPFLIMKRENILGAFPVESDLNLLRKDGWRRNTRSNDKEMLGTRKVAFLLNRGMLILFRFIQGSFNRKSYFQNRESKDSNF